MKLKRLSGRKICGNVLRKGKTWKGTTMTVKWLPGPPRSPNIPSTSKGLFVGTYASTKLHKSAVVRNRMRRRVREALRLEVASIATMSPIQLLISPRPASLDAPFEDIRQDAQALLSHLSSSFS